MDNKYIENGYIICKTIGDVINQKINIPVKCKTKADAEDRVNFLKFHNLITLFDFCVDADDFISFFGADNYQKICKIVNKSAFKQLKCDLMSDNISQSFSKAGIKHIVLKGTEYKKFYPDNIVRISNDIDIYIQMNYLETAEKVLNEKGFVFDISYDNKEFQYKKEPRYSVELHTAMDGFNVNQESILLSLANNAEKVSGNRYSLNNNDFYIFSLFHLYKHFVQSGAGVRMFLDVFLIKKNGNLDFEYINNKLKALNIDGFESVVTKINLCLFEAMTAADDIKDVIEFIFESTTFGKASTNLYLSKINNKIFYSSNFEQLKLDTGLSFTAMKNRYPLLNKLPVLYPFSLVYRFIYGLTHKRKLITNAQKFKKSIPSHKLNKYKKIFKTVKIDISK